MFEAQREGRDKLCGGDGSHQEQSF